MTRFRFHDLRPEGQAQDPLEDELRAFGERFSLPPERSTAIRSAVLLEFNRAAREAAATRQVDLPWWRTMGLLRPARPIAAAAVLVLLLLSGSGLAAAQSGPGQAFYNVRLTLERMTVPWATPAQRLTSNLQYLDARLNDVRSSASAENENGIAAAVAAYEAGLQQILQGGEAPGMNAAQVAQALDTRAAALAALLNRVPPQARPGLQNAMQQTSQVGEKLQQLSASPPGLEKGGPGPAATPAGPTGAPGQQAPGSIDNGKGNAGQPGNGGANRGGPNATPGSVPGSAPSTNASHRPDVGRGSTLAPGLNPGPTPSPTPSPAFMSGQSGH